MDEGLWIPTDILYELISRRLSESSSMECICICFLFCFPLSSLTILDASMNIDVNHEFVTSMLGLL